MPSSPAKPLKITVPPATLPVLMAYVRLHQVPLDEAVTQLLESVATAVKFNGTLLRGIGKEWEDVVKEMKRAPDEKESRTAVVTLTEAQLKSLERSETLDSGYAHVYPNASKTRWRAQVKQGGKWTFLRFRKTPQEAAWDRLVFMQGAGDEPLLDAREKAIREAIEEIRPDYPDYTEEQLRAWAEEMENLRKPKMS